MTMIFVLLEALFEVIIPTLMAYLVDNGIDVGNMDYIIKMGIVILISAMLGLLWGVLSGVNASVASCGLAANLRHDMYENIQRFSFKSIDKFSTASIVTRLTTDTTNVQNAYIMIVRTALRCPLVILFSLIAAFNLHRGMSLIFLISIPILGFILVYIANKCHPVFEKVFRLYDKLNRVVQENVRGMRVVKSFVREDHEVEKFEGISKVVYEDFSKAEKIVAYNVPALQAVSYICMLLIAWIGAKAVIASGNEASLGLTTGALLSLVAYCTQILMSLLRFSQVYVMIIIARSSAGRIAEILNEKSELHNPENPEYSVNDGSIEYKNVNFGYSETATKLVLDNINLKIESGSTVGIIGATGSSKSSLVQLIPRLYDVSEGEVLVGGKNVKDYDIESLRNQVAVVLQKNELFSGSIKENLRWGDENATDEEIKEACKLACADEFIETFPDKYDTYIEQGGTNVSGGQKQRLCIARALLKKPKILILDDSTSAVDTKTDASIRRAFAEKIPDTTKIIIAQRISSVQDADMIVIMNEGKIAAVGKHEDLLANNVIYKEVFESQRKGGEGNE
ncbi:MAG: ABC transporter ATP-binding protein/permease [Parasporobacterium sp.]|nr:ABC transporter ATP-binding protein/permease [Parasporobacterium sp.]